MSSKVKVDRLSKFYGIVVGLNDVSFEINTGITGLLGPNGAGKSTFMKLLTGQLRPSSGTITLDGEPIWKNPNIFHKIGFCPEQDVLYPYLTGLQFVESMLNLHGISGREAKNKAIETMTYMGMADAMDRKISGYSRGMRQRTKLAQAIAHDPEFLILDEPLTGLDPVARNFMVTRVKELGASGKSVVISSHVLHEVENMTEDFLLINHGRILASGNITDIRGLLNKHPHRIDIMCDPVTPFLQRLMGEHLISGLEIKEKKNEFTIMCHDAQRFYDELPKILIETNTKLESIQSDSDNLDTVFSYLLSEAT